MVRRDTSMIETEADRYWREKTSPSSFYGAEFAVLAVFLLVMALN